MQLAVFPVPLNREHGDHVVVQVHVPHDLTHAEAEKICRIVMALAKPK